MVENITYLLIGNLFGAATVLIIVFWNNLIRDLVEFFTFRKLKYRLKLKWWEIKFFIRYKVLRK